MTSGTETADSAARRARFEESIAPEVDFLARVARSMSKSGAEAEDLAQDTLLKAYRGLDGFDGRHPRAWLYRIARNTAINRDQRNRELLLSEDEDLDVAGDAQAEPEAQVIGPILDHDLESALDALPPSFRMVLQLVDVEGMRYHEAAEVLEVPVGTIMSRLHRARRRVRRALAGSPLDRSTEVGT